MEIRDSKVLFSKGGSGGYSSRVSIPINWLRELQIDIDNKDIELKFDGNKITIEKRGGRSL